MADEEQSSARLLEEVAALRQWITVLETSEAAHQRAEEALQASEQRYRLLLDAANDAVLVFPPTAEGMPGTFIEVNAAACQRLGYTKEEFLHLSILDILPPEKLSDVSPVMQKLFTERHLVFETVHVAKDGRQIPVEVSSHLFDFNGQPTVFSLARDISARKELEQHRADFLAMLTHDIRNPVGVILGYTEVLLEEAHERNVKGAQNFLERLKSNAQTIHSLVTNYLDLSQIEAGGLTLTKKPLALDSMLRRVGQQYEIETRRRRITLKLRLQEALPLVAGDALALERVFANLLNNALKFTPRMGRITISAVAQGDEVMVSVTDTGLGMAPEEIPLVFQRYRRAIASWSQEGVGLGLFIVRTFIEAHGGRVEVESTLGRGSRFMVFLPVASADEPR